MFNKILCPTDGSDHASKALNLAIDLARNYDAELIVLHVSQHFENMDSLRRFAEVEGLAPQVNSELARLDSTDFRFNVAAETSFQDAAISPRLLMQIGQYIVEDAKSLAGRKGLDKVETRVVSGDAADRILNCVEQDGVDCVIMGSRGLNDLKGLFLGSVSHKVANRASCSCISVK